MTQVVIDLVNVSKYCKNKPALRSLSAKISKGQIIGLVGRNGAGKTTLLESIMGLKEISEGHISVCDKTIDNLSQNQEERIGFVPQDSIGFEWMKVADYLNYFGGFFGGWSQDYSDSLVARWKIDKRSRIADLSGGQQQILQVIQALFIKPSLLILDEPVAHLDPNMRRQFLAELVDLTCELGTSVIFSTHIISDLERVASHIALLNNGQIDYFYELDELKQNTAHIILDKNPDNTKDYPQIINWAPLEKGSKVILARPEGPSISDLEKEMGVSIKSNTTLFRRLVFRGYQ